MLMKLGLFRRRLLEGYAGHKRSMPWRRTRDAYRVWISEVMLQQTRVAAVVGYYGRFVRRFPTVRSLARASEGEVLKYWAGLGYYSRARNLHRAARQIVAQHGGRFPREFDAALALPGVGRYTAAAVLSIAYDAPHAVLDGNVARVLARLHALRGDLRLPRRWRQLQSLADKLLPSHSAEIDDSPAPAVTRHQVARSELRGGERRPFVRRKRTQSKQAAAVQGAAATRRQKGGQAGMPVLPGEWNQAMMELGAAVCTPRAPRCGACPVARWCRAHHLGIAEEIPAARRKPATVSVTLAAAVLLDARGRTLLLPPNGDLHDGLFSRLWQFPAVGGGTKQRERLGARLRQLSNGKGKASTQRGRVASREIQNSKFQIQDQAIRCTEAQRTPRQGRVRQEIRRATRKNLGLVVQGTQSYTARTEAADFVALQPAKHTVTFREVTLHPFLLRVAQLPQIAGARTPWLDQLDALAVSSATRKIARRALEFLATRA